MVLSNQGKVAKAGRTVFVNYVGRLQSNNRVFDKSRGKPLRFKLGKGSSLLSTFQVSHSFTVRGILASFDFFSPTHSLGICFNTPFDVQET